MLVENLRAAGSYLPQKELSPKMTRSGARSPEAKEAARQLAESPGRTR